MSQPAFIKAEGFTRVMAEGAGKGEEREAYCSGENAGFSGKFCNVRIVSRGLHM
jgi:hypothetical protein